MSRHQQFVTLVQTAAIVESLSRTDRKDKHPGPSSTAAAAVACAIQVPESALPNDLCQACDELIRHIYDNTTPKPHWLIGVV